VQPCKGEKADDIPGLDFWLPPNIPENESGLINLEEPLKLPFRTAHSSGFLHHPPPFQRQKRNSVDLFLSRENVGLPAVCNFECH